MRTNHVLQAWREDSQTIGAWLSIDSVLTAETLTRAGFDWLCLDMQHGFIGYEDVKVMLPAISQTETIPFVRVPWNDPATIMKVLDAGAYGVVVPLVNNREEAERAVAACRYPPQGIRSSGPIRAAMYGGHGYVREANNEIACIVMVETAEALENLDDIISTPGVDAIYIGPSDLAYALGLTPTGDNSEPSHVAAVNRIFECCRKHGVAAGIHTSSVEYSKRYLAQGFHMITLNTDRGFMARQVRDELSEVRAAPSSAPPETGPY